MTYFTSVVEPTANSCFHEQESPILTVSHTLDCWNAYCNCRDVTSIYSLKSRKLPGHFPYGLGTRLRDIQLYITHECSKHGHTHPHLTHAHTHTFIHPIHTAYMNVCMSYYKWSPTKAVPPDCLRQNNWSPPGPSTAP